MDHPTVLCFPCDGWQVCMSMDEGGTRAFETGLPNTVPFLLFITHFCLFARIIGFVPTGSPWASTRTVMDLPLRHMLVSHSHTERGISFTKAKSPEEFLIIFLLPTFWVLKAAVVHN